VIHCISLQHETSWQRSFVKLVINIKNVGVYNFALLFYRISLPICHHWEEAKWLYGLRFGLSPVVRWSYSIKCWTNNKRTCRLFSTLILQCFNL